MPKSHCHLPHWRKDGTAYFVTWRLYGSLPVSVTADCWAAKAARFFRTDRLPDATATGPHWLKQPEIAGCVVRNLLESEEKGQCELGAWVVMSNHVHLVLRPLFDLPKVISGIKACSARDANRVLGKIGRPFWARDYFDRWIRSDEEEKGIAGYIEQNPVKAGLCKDPEDWPWSSANDRWRRNAAIAACP